MKIINCAIGNSVKRALLRRILVVIPLLLACLTVVPGAQAVSPPPDGGYPGGNTAEGNNALFSLTTGINNTAVGFNALRADTTGAYNVAVGSGALQNNTTGFQNMAIGAEALGSNTGGNFNMAIGFRALNMNTGNRNTAVGAAALRNNTFAEDNTAIGSQALKENSTGEQNTATGSFALFGNTTGRANTAMGYDALGGNSTGGGNTAIGWLALGVNQTGENNTGIGGAALTNSTSGGGNTAIGNGALLFNRTGNDNIALGEGAGGAITGNNNIDIGNPGDGSDSNTIRIGNGHTATHIAGISEVPVAGSAVFVNSSGQLGVAGSSARFKDEIKPMNNASETILALEPVTFRYKKGMDPDRRPQFGLVAEQVEKINPDLVSRDADGKPFTVRYDAVNAMLLNEFLKEHRKVEQQRKDFEAALARQQQQIEALTAGLQKVNAQLEMAKPAGKLARSDQ